MTEKTSKPSRLMPITLSVIAILLLLSTCAAALYAIFIAHQTTQTVHQLSKDLSQTAKNRNNIEGTLDILNEAHISLQTELARLTNQIQSNQNFKTQNKIWIAEQARYYLELAHLEAKSGTGDVAACEILIKQAQKLINVIQDPSLLPVQDAMIKALDTLQALPHPDPAQILTQLHQLEDELYNAVYPATVSTDASSSQPTAGQTHLQNSMQTLQNFITIKRHHINALPETTIQQLIIMNRINLNIQEASLALTSRDSKLYHLAIGRAQMNVEHTFNTEPILKQSMLNTLKQLAAVEFTPSLPPLNGPLDALNQWIKTTDSSSPRP